MRILFIGTGPIGLPVLRWLVASEQHELVGVVTQPDKPVGRSQRIVPSPIKAALHDLAVPVLQPERIKRETAIAEIHALPPEIIVVMAYGQILPRSVLDIPTVACLNLHASLLPRHRGAAPIQAAIAAGDSETGITVMYMDDGLDTGDILLEERIAIGQSELGGELHDRLGELAPTALARALDHLQNGNAPRVPQVNADATYAPKLERENGRIDWTQPGTSIERKIRAFNPWPGSYAVLRDSEGRERKLKILRARPGDETGLAAGQLLASAEAGLVIGAGSGSLRLEEVQLEGKKAMPALDLIRGNSWLSSASVIAVCANPERPGN